MAIKGTIKYQGYRGTKSGGMKNKRRSKVEKIRRDAEAKQRRFDEAKARRESFDYDWGEDSQR